MGFTAAVNWAIVLLLLVMVEGQFPTCHVTRIEGNQDKHAVVVFIIELQVINAFDTFFVVSGDHVGIAIVVTVVNIFFVNIAVFAIVMVAVEIHRMPCSAGPCPFSKKIPKR